MTTQQEYEEYDFFVIDKFNYLQQKELLFGYKTIKDEGFWLHIFWEKDILKIQGSFIQPCIAIFRQGQYWAISNSPYLLSQYLIEKGYTLTSNKQCCLLNKTFLFGVTKGYSMTEYDDFSTYWNEITLDDNFCSYEIVNGKLITYKKPNTFFFKELSNNIAVVKEWYSKYQNFLNSIENAEKELVCDLSGGVDSRLLFSLWKDKNVKNVNCNWKNGVNAYYDGLIGRLLVSQFSPQNFSKIKEKKQKGEKIDIEYYKPFWNGIRYYDDRENYGPLKNKKQYLLQGIGTEGYKTLFANDYNKLLNCIRRYVIPTCILKKYLYNKITILPFLDSELLQLKGKDNFDFMWSLYIINSVNFYKEIPFFSNTSIFSITEEEIESIKKTLNIK